MDSNWTWQQNEASVLAHVSVRTVSQIANIACGDPGSVELFVYSLLYSVYVQNAVCAIFSTMYIHTECVLQYV